MKPSIAKHSEQNVIRVTENLRVIRDLLAKAGNDAGCGDSSVKLLAVSKKQPVSAVLAAAKLYEQMIALSSRSNGLATPSFLRRLNIRESKTSDGR